MQFITFGSVLYRQYQISYKFPTIGHIGNFVYFSYTSLLTIRTYVRTYVSVCC